MGHPTLMAGVLVGIALIRAILLGKLGISWVFYLLALVFLGGVIVVLLFIVSVCANEKFFYGFKFFNLGTPPLILWALWGGQPFMITGVDFSSFNIAGVLFERDAALPLISFIGVLVLCLVSVVSVRKVESGPLVKRL